MANDSLAPRPLHRLAHVLIKLAEQTITSPPSGAPTHLPRHTTIQRPMTLLCLTTCPPQQDMRAQRQDYRPLIRGAPPRHRP